MCPAVGLLWNSGNVLDLLGRDDTFTGRTDIWDAALGSIGSRPIFGYGFGAFWRGEAGPSKAVVDSVDWVTPNAHNGVLDLCLELGIAGLLVFAIGFGQRFRTALQEYRRQESSGAMWPFLFLSFLLVYNLTESTLLVQNSLSWALYASLLVRSGPAPLAGCSRSTNLPSSGLSDRLNPCQSPGLL